MNQLASGADLCASPECGHCGKTLEELERQVISIGNRLRSAGEQSEADSTFLSMIEHRIVSGLPSSGVHPPREIGVYEIGELLGRGGMGNVYKATHKHLRKMVAIKLLPEWATNRPEALSRFQQEMQAVGRLDHPNVVRAMDAGNANGTSFLTMELLSGCDLARLVSGQRSLRTADACELIRQAAKGLHYAHSQGLIHRDVKPANLMLAIDSAGRPVVKVMDLGLALLTEYDASVPATDDGQLMGTLEFMAPEQASHSGQVDYRADIYALGATLFRLLTGSVPFEGRQYKTRAQRLVALSSEAAPSVASLRSNLPSGLVELVDRMLSRDPASRPDSMSQIADMLLQYCQRHDLRELLQQELHSQVTQGSSAIAMQFGDTFPSTNSTWSELQAASKPLERSVVGRRWTARFQSPRIWIATVAMCILLGGGMWLRSLETNIPGADKFHPEIVPEHADLERQANDVMSSRPVVRRLKVQFQFIRNELYPETLLHSECRFIPFATYPTFAPESPEHAAALAEWNQILHASHGRPEKAFELPDWMLDARRVPLQGFGPIQKDVHIECPEGNNWCGGDANYFDEIEHIIELKDDAKTTEVDETLQVGFLFITRLESASDRVEHFEFRTLEEMYIQRGPITRQGYLPREI